MSKSIRLPAKERKKVIVKAAIDAFAESNYHKATILEISKRAGITDPMIYKFFDSKKELFIEVLTLTNNKSRQIHGVHNFITEQTFTSIDNVKKVFGKSIMSNFNSMDKYKKEIKVFYQAISEIDDEDIKKVINQIYRKFADTLIPPITKAINLGVLSNQLNAELLAWEIVGFTIQQNILFLVGLYNEENIELLLNKMLDTWFI